MMKEQIKEELGKFTKIREGSDDELRAVILTDIIASLMTVEKNDEGKSNRSYEKFDSLVDNIKGFIEGVDHVPDNIDLIDSIESSINSIKRINKECDYCIRTLTWVDSLLEEEQTNA